MIPFEVGQRIVSFTCSNHDQETCRICGSRGSLTNEHVPPKGSGNSKKRRWAHFSEGAPGSASVGIGSKEFQRGFKLPTVCQRCNNGVLSRCQASYIEFARRVGDDVPVYDPDGAAVVRAPKDHRAFIRAVVGMILAVEPVRFGEAHRDLRGFVLGQRERVEIPCTVHAFRVPNSRFAGTIQPMHGRVDTFAPGFGLVAAGEISAWPLGFVYSFGKVGEAYQSASLPEIGHWARYDRISCHLALPTRLTVLDSINRAVAPRAGPEWGAMPPRRRR